MNIDHIRELLRRGSYAGAPLRGQLIETYISWVILTRQWAFKIKRPIKYPFLDFSTLERRKYFCEREVFLNSRLTDIYKEVMPIHEDMTIGQGSGAIIDYAVRMKRLQGPKRMDEMLRNGKVRQEHIHRLAEKIADFHQLAQVVGSVNGDHLHRRFNDLVDIAPWVRDHLGKKYAGQIEDAVTWSDAFLQAHEHYMASRVQQGFTRDVHGDLHARNIFLYREPIVFDCIEFNDKYRQIDVLNEVAFFCMDLEASGHRDLSREFMDRYLQLFPCMAGTEDEALFQYYKFYRASVRVKVNGLRAMQAPPLEEGEYQRETVRYLQFMRHLGKELGLEGA